MKKQLEDFLYDSLKTRVQYQVTNYRKAHEQTGRTCIIVDKKEVWNMRTIVAEIKVNEKIDEIHKNQQIEYDIENGEQNRNIGDQAYDQLNAEGIFSQYDFLESVKAYFNLSIAEALNSTNMLIKILAILDRRCGKRTLQQMKEFIQDEKELIQYFYQLRCEAEGID